MHCKYFAIVPFISVFFKIVSVKQKQISPVAIKVLPQNLFVLSLVLILAYPDGNPVSTRLATWVCICNETTWIFPDSFGKWISRKHSTTFFTGDTTFAWYSFSQRSRRLRFFLCQSKSSFQTLHNRRD
jgi:hypothetical protein